MFIYDDFSFEGKASQRAQAALKAPQKLTMKEGDLKTPLLFKAQTMSQTSLTATQTAFSLFSFLCVLSEQLE